MPAFLISGSAQFVFGIEAEDRGEAIRKFTAYKGDLEGTLDLRINDIECNEVKELSPVSHTTGPVKLTGNVVE